MAAWLDGQGASIGGLRLAGGQSGKNVIKNRIEMQLCHSNQGILVKISGKGSFWADGMPFELSPASNNIT